MGKKEAFEEKSLTRRSLLSGAGKIAVVGAGISRCLRRSESVLKGRGCQEEGFRTSMAVQEVY